MSQFQYSQPLPLSYTPLGGGRKRKSSATYGSRKKAKTAVARIPRPRFTSRVAPGAFPQKKRVTLSYVEYFSTTPNISGGAAGKVFRMNGMQDPNFTDAGHQPLGFDQWSAFYNRYTVMSSKIVVSTSSIEPLVKGAITGIVIYNSGVALPSTADIIGLSEDPDGCSGVVAHDGTPCVLTKNVDIAKFYSISNPLEDDTLQAAVSTNPARMPYAYVWHAVAPGTLTVGGLLTFQVRITYDVVFTEPKDLATS